MNNINNATSKIRIFDGFWSVDDVRKNPNFLFVYGDNNVKSGKRGQAIIRDELNSIGIPTKKYPSNHSNSFYTDFEYTDNVKRINDAIELIIKKSTLYQYIILPKDGFGIGLAQLSIKAPKTYKYLNESIKILCRKI